MKKAIKIGKNLVGWGDPHYDKSEMSLAMV